MRKMDWKFEPPKDLNQKVWLFTIMGVGVPGYWTGRHGEFYIAWDHLNER